MIKPVLLMLAVISPFFLAACEGGKSRPSLNCGANEYEERGQCKAKLQQCTTDQVLINGACQSPTTACEAGYHLDGGQCVKSTLALEVLSQNACYNPTQGTTRIIFQYVTRDEQGYAISPEPNAQNQPTALENQLYINGKAESESVLAQDSELLRSDVFISLVLDTSSSMLDGDTPAFTPMKNAAREVLLSTQSLWQSTQSSFYWELAWFNNFIYTPAPNNAGETWGIDDIISIPAPENTGSFTALYKAVDYMLGIHSERYGQGTAAGVRDQHVMVVFTDGFDNYSYFDNASEQAEINNNAMLFWNAFGAEPTTTVEDIAWNQAPPEPTHLCARHGQ